MRRYAAARAASSRAAAARSAGRSKGRVDPPARKSTHAARSGCDDWDGYGWGYGPYGGYGGYYDGYYGGYGDGYYGGYTYGPSYDRQPGYAVAPAPRTGPGVYMDEANNAVFVRSVVPDSPAEQAGLEPGDQLIAINGNLITSADQVRQIVAQHEPGDELEIETARDGRELRTAAVLEEHRQVF